MIQFKKCLDIRTRDVVILICREIHLVHLFCVYFVALALQVATQCIFNPFYIVDSKRKETIRFNGKLYGVVISNYQPNLFMLMRYPEIKDDLRLCVKNK